MKPLTGLPLPNAGREQELSSDLSEGETARISAAPVTPVTPLTAEAFLALRDFILERDAQALEEAGSKSDK